MHEPPAWPIQLFHSATLYWGNMFLSLPSSSHNKADLAACRIRRGNKFPCSLASWTAKLNEILFPFLTAISEHWSAQLYWRHFFNLPWLFPVPQKFLWTFIIFVACICTILSGRARALSAPCCSSSGFRFERWGCMSSAVYLTASLPCSWNSLTLLNKRFESSRSVVLATSVSAYS